MFGNEELDRLYDSISHVGSERAIMSISMNDPERLFDVATYLEPEDFTNVSNRFIYQIMLEILDNKFDNIGKVNPMIIYSLAQGMGIEEEIGGMPYLQMLAKTEAGEENLDFYIGKVKQASIRKESFKKAYSVIQESVDSEEDDIDSFVSRQEDKFLDIVMKTENSSSTIVRIGDVVDVVLEDRENAPKDILGVPTGFMEYDKNTGGLVPGRLKVVAATPKTGKSAHALNVALNIAENVGLPVLYIDTEMQTGEQIDRGVSILATDSGTLVPESVVQRGTYINNPRMKLAVDNIAKPKLKEMPFYHVYMPDFNPEKIHNIARKFQRQHGVSWNGFENQFVLIFDYIKLDEDSHKKNLQEYIVLGQITNMLKNKIAGALNIPVLAYAQVNPRTGYNAEEINSSHISGSNRIVMYVNELSILRKKTDDEIQQDGLSAGNRVWTVGESRNGGEYKGWIHFDTARGVAKMREVKNIALGE